MGPSLHIFLRFLNLDGLPTIMFMLFVVPVIVGIIFALASKKNKLTFFLLSAILTGLLAYVIMDLTGMII